MKSGEREMRESANGRFFSKNGGNTKFLTTTLLLINTLINGSSSFASFQGDVQSEMFKYASEASPTFYFAGHSQFQTGSFLGKMKGYYESGPRGAWSFDPNPLKYSILLGPTDDILWIGREHPLQPTRSTQIDPNTALGNIWVQNNINALDPSVSGWIGAGYTKRFDKNWSITGAYSPIFIPTFGPSLGMTDRGTLNPSRFATLPPDQVDINGNRYSIRYHIQIDSLKDIIFQQQGLLATTYDSEEFHFDVYAYTAPDPNPVTPVDAKIAIQQSSVNLQANIKPEFPRNEWAGTQVQAKEIPFQPSVEFVQNLETAQKHFASVTGYVPVSPRMRASFGLLTHLGQKLDTPQRSDWLLFLRVPFELTDHLDFRTLLETTLQSDQQSFYWYNQLEYLINNTFSVLGEIRMLSGQDASYFGQWRNQDSYSVGVKALW